MIPNGNDFSKEKPKSHDKENIGEINHNIDDQETIWNTELDSQYNRTYQILARVLIGIILLSFLFGISFAIVLGIRLYQGDRIFFSYNEPSLAQISNQKKEESNNNNTDQYDLDQSSQPQSDQIHIKKRDHSKKSNDSNADLSQTDELISNKKQSESEYSYKQENVNIKLFNEEISNLKSLILNLNKSYNDIANRLEKAEKIIENPLKNPNIQRMISLIILSDTINRGEYTLDERIFPEGISKSTLDSCTAVLMKFANVKIPTLLEISSQFPKVSEEMISAVESIDKDLGFINYLIYQVKQLIKVRFTGDIDGNKITALMSRIENHLKNGDLNKASSEWNKIPEKAQKPGIFLRNAIEAHICSDKIIKEELAKISNKNLL